MAGDIFTATGTKIYIGPAAASTVDTTSAIAALTPYVEIGLVETIGEYGDESSAVTFSALGDARTRKAKGAKDAGTLAITCAHDGSDDGQTALNAAEGTNLNYAFKVELPNKLNATGTDEVNYFRGLVMSKRKNVGGNDNVVRVTFNVGINSEIYVVDATAGT